MAQSWTPIVILSAASLTMSMTTTLPTTTSTTTKRPGIVKGDTPVCDGDNKEGLSNYFARTRRSIAGGVAITSRSVVRHENVKSRVKRQLWPLRISFEPIGWGRWRSSYGDWRGGYGGWRGGYGGWRGGYGGWRGGWRRGCWRRGGWRRGGWRRGGWWNGRRGRG